MSRTEGASMCQGIQWLLRCPKSPQSTDHGDLEPVWGGMSSATWSGGSGDAVLSPLP